jgi:hypothetical protein
MANINYYFFETQWFHSIDLARFSYILRSLLLWKFLFLLSFFYREEIVIQILELSSLAGLHSLSCHLVECIRIIKPVKYRVLLYNLENHPSGCKISDKLLVNTVQSTEAGLSLSSSFFWNWKKSNGHT